MNLYFQYGGLSLIRKGLTITIILLLVGMCMMPSFAVNTEQSPQLLSRGNWYYVGGSGPGNYTRIQDALDNASDGDTVFVYSNIYSENVLINKSVQLLGENRQTTIIRCVTDQDTVTIRGSTINISNFNIQTNGTYIWPYCIKIEQSSNVNVFNCECSSTTSYSYCGISADDSNNISIMNVLVHDVAEGITFRESFNCRVQHCECYKVHQQSIAINKGSEIYINDSIVRDGSGVFSQGICVFSNETYINNCQVINISDNGIQLLGNFGSHPYNRKSARIQNTTIRDCRNNICAIWIENYDTILITNCEIANSAAAGLHIKDSGDVLIYRNNFIDNNKRPRVHSAYIEWDNGKIGNYWSDSNIKDSNGDLIGDSNYSFDYGVDHFPIILPFGKTIGVRIIHPLENFSYIRNFQCRQPRINTFLFGTTKVVVAAGTFDSPTVAKVKFYVDGILRHIDTRAPYTWTWRLNSMKIKHTLKVVAEDESGHTVFDRMAVFRFGVPASIKILIAGILAYNLLK